MTQRPAMPSRQYTAIPAIRRRASASPRVIYRHRCARPLEELMHLTLPVLIDVEFSHRPATPLVCARTRSGSSPARMRRCPPRPARTAARTRSSRRGEDDRAGHGPVQRPAQRPIKVRLRCRRDRAALRGVLISHTGNVVPAADSAVTRRLGCATSPRVRPWRSACRRCTQDRRW